MVRVVPSLRRKYRALALVSSSGASQGSSQVRRQRLRNNPSWTEEISDWPRGASTAEAVLPGHVESMSSGRVKRPLPSGCCHKSCSPPYIWTSGIVLLYSPSKRSRSWVERVPSGVSKTTEMAIESVSWQDRVVANPPSGAAAPGAQIVAPVPLSTENSIFVPSA